ncbi:MAG: glycoside hydrolase family 5 protein, partial [Treponema sp.]|nr:glycoside hydrolase family 5 protein [Treponema sp.]
HDGGDSQESWIKKATTNETEITDKFKKVWKQIADKFAFKSDYLVFEAMNEVGFDNLSINKAQELLTRLNQVFVDTVRASGGLNPERFLLVSGYWTDIDRTCDSQYQLPVDKQNKLLLSIHYYTPADFCIAERPDNSWGFSANWGTEVDKAKLTAQFSKLKTRFLDVGTPVILGEYGVVKNNKVEDGRIQWLTAVTQICLDNGICPVLWDTGAEISRKPPFTMSESLRVVLDAVIR